MARKESQCFFSKQNREMSSITIRLIVKKTCGKTVIPREQGLDPSSDGSFNNDFFKLGDIFLVLVFNSV